jgi:hypothetical protein
MTMNKFITVHGTEVQQQIITQCNVINPDDTSISTEHLNVQADVLWDTEQPAQPSHQNSQKNLN